MILVCSIMAGVLKMFLSGFGLGFAFNVLREVLFLVVGFMLLPCWNRGKIVGAVRFCGKRCFPQTHVPYYRKCIGVLSKGLRHKLLRGFSRIATTNCA
jgi:hypothetical protein